MIKYVSFSCFVGSERNTGDKCISAAEQSGLRKEGFKGCV